MKPLFLFFVALLSLSGCGNDSSRALQLHGQTMGTTWHVTIPHSVSRDKKKLQLSIQKELDDINQKFSTYIPTSEISQFNNSPTTQPFNVSKAVVDVIQSAQTLSEKTHGAFDITVAPLINLWGFGSNIILSSPNGLAISQAKTTTGYHHLKVLSHPSQLVKDIPNLQIDLSAIAKGYAVDKLSDLLDKHREKNYLVEIGGEIKVKGMNSKNQPWKIAIEKPIFNLSMQKNTEAQRVISLKDIAVATSGDYHNYFEEKGIRYSHTINPFTGKPVQHQLASVTVLHPSAMVADSMATAIMVLGEERGLQFANQEKLEVYMIIRGKKNQFRSISTLKQR